MENMNFNTNETHQKSGRPQGSKHYNYIQIVKKRGLTQSQTARYLRISISTVKRNWNGGVID